MYITKESCEQLDIIVKDFEVAYRSYVVDIIKASCVDYVGFERMIKNLDASFGVCSIVGTYKYKAKLLKIKGEMSSRYSEIDQCFQVYKARDYAKCSVPYVSDIIDYVLLFFNPLFSGLAKEFSQVEEFVSLSNKYQSIRNSLAHPASSKILATEATEIVKFISKLVFLLDDKYFWYERKSVIEGKIDAFSLRIYDVGIKIHNLTEVGSLHRKLVCRDDELAEIRSMVLGEDKYSRTRDSIVIYGYGGIGKTALVVEFLYTLIRDYKSLHTPVSFLLFFSSKDEVLKLIETSGKLVIDDVRRQVASYKELEGKLFGALGISDIKQLGSLHGIVVLDNIENLTKEDKDALFKLIKKSPTSIKYILTSRNEESQCEGGMHLQGYKKKERGVEFIDALIKAYGYDVDLDDAQKAKLVESSRGNTLILVLTLQKLSTGRHLFGDVLAQLDDIESQNISIIADFMYKNTFDETIAELQAGGYDPISLIKVVSLYGEPIDIYSISKLADMARRDAEEICNSLTQHLILEKNQGLFSLNEFAHKFIFIKYLPDKTETNRLGSKIASFKHNIKDKLETLVELKHKNSNLDKLFKDWKPVNYTDEIVIAEAFSLYGEIEEKCRTHSVSLKIDEVISKFDNLLNMSSHPYIIAQKVRVFELLLLRKHFPDKDRLISLTASGYEEVINLIDFHYQFIKYTKSYAQFIFGYGKFLFEVAREPHRAIRYLELVRDIGSALIKDKFYLTNLNKLSYYYLHVYRSAGDKHYLSQLRSVYSEVKRLSSDKCLNDQFRFSDYYKAFSDFVN